MRTETRLTDEQITTLRASQVGVVTGIGTGIGGALMAAFTTTPIGPVLTISSEMPDEEETKLLQLYVRFRATRFFSARVAAMEVPQVAGGCAVIFTKGGWWRNGNPGWSYRRMTWTSGPTFYPLAREGEPVFSLRELLDDIEKDCPKRWDAWKEREGVTG